VSCNGKACLSRTQLPIQISCGCADLTALWAARLAVTDQHGHEGAGLAGATKRGGLAGPDRCC